MSQTKKQLPDLTAGGKMNGAHALMRSLIAQGVDTMFGYPGGAAIPLFTAYAKYKKAIRNFLPGHEQGGIHAAEGYARMLRKPGVVMVTSGPGALNLMSGLADAKADSTPIVAITGQVSTSVIGTEAFQEADVITATKPVTKWNYQVQTAAEIPDVVKEAFFQATNGRPGPVLIDIPKDIQLKVAHFERFTKDTSLPQPLKNSDHQKQLEQAAKLLNESKRPFIIAGHGVLISGAEKKLLELAQKGDIPVATTLLGKSAFPENHPLSKGMMGMHGHFSPNVLAGKADTVLVVGMRFDDRVVGKPSEFLPNAKIIHIDIDGDRFNKVKKTGVKPAEIAINLDAKIALNGILENLKKAQHPDWLKQFVTFEKDEYKQVTKGQLFPKSDNLTQSEVLHLISEVTQGQAVVVADVGQHQMFSALRYKTSKPNSFVTSGGSGTMGYALPAAIGAKIAVPQREVIAVIGDGSFQMTLQEMTMLKNYNLAVKVIIMNNHYLGMVRQWQELFEDELSEVNLNNPDFTLIASAYGIPSARITRREDLLEAVKKMRQTDGPYLLDVDVEKAENVFPMVPSGHRTHHDTKLK